VVNKTVVRSLKRYCKLRFDQYLRDSGVDEKLLEAKDRNSRRITLKKRRSLVEQFARDFVTPIKEECD